VILQFSQRSTNDLLARTIFFFTTTRRLMFCLITVIVSLAVHDGA
jgi:hypothetical protein